MIDCPIWTNETMDWRCLLVREHQFDKEAPKVGRDCVRRVGLDGCAHHSLQKEVVNNEEAENDTQSLCVNFLLVKSKESPTNGGRKKFEISTTMPSKIALW